MKFTELSNITKFFHGNHTTNEVCNNKSKDKSANIRSPGVHRDTQKDTERGMDKPPSDARIVKLGSPKRSATVKQNYKDKNHLGTKRALSKLKVSASLRRLSKINLQSHITGETVSGTLDTSITPFSLDLKEESKNMKSAPTIYSAKTGFLSECSRDCRKDYKLPSFEVINGSPSTEHLNDAFSPRIHTSMYIQQMISKDSQIVHEADLTLPKFNKITLDGSNSHFVEDSLFSFESSKCQCTMNPTSNLRLNLKKGELLGLGITTPIYKTIHSHNSYFNSYLVNSPQITPSSCKDPSYEILKPINKSSIVKSNRRPFQDIKNVNVVDTQLITPLKHHNKELFTDSMLKRSESMYSISQNRQSKIQKRAQLDSKHHLTLAHSLNSNCTRNDTLENADTNSIYDGLSAAEIQDYQKVKMWANY